MALIEPHTTGLLRVSFMFLFERIKFLFMTPSLPLRSTERDREVMRDIVSKHSHGNIFLQWGQYYTKRDVDARYEIISKVSF